MYVTVEAQRLPLFKPLETEAMHKKKNTVKAA